MLSLFSKVLVGLGTMVASFGTNACVVVFVDEPECPKSLIK